MIEVEDLPPSVISAAEALVQAIDSSGLLPVHEKPLDVRTRVIAYVAVAMYDPTVQIFVQQLDVDDDDDG